MSLVATLQILVTANTSSASASLNRVQGQLTATEAAANKSTKGVSRMGQASSMAAKGGVAALGYGLYKSISVGMDFQKQMSGLQAVTKASGGQMDQFKKQALDMGAKTIFGARDVAQAQTELAKGGLRTGDILGGALPAALSLAAAGELDLATAANTTANAMNLFGLKGRDAGQVADMLATAANTTTADVGDFATALTQGGSAAKQAGLSLNDTVVILESLANAGIKNSDAGTSMKTALLQLLSPTAKQAALAKQLGLSFINQAGAMKSPIRLAGDLRKATEGMTKAQRVAAFKTLAGTDGFRTLAALYDTGAKKARGLAKANEKVGTSQETASTKTDNLSGDLERLKGSLETQGITVFDQMEPALRTTAQLLDEGVTGKGTMGWMFENGAKQLAGIVAPATAVNSAFKSIATVGSGKNDNFSSIANQIDTINKATISVKAGVDATGVIPAANRVAAGVASVVNRKKIKVAISVAADAVGKAEKVGRAIKGALNISPKIKLAADLTAAKAAQAAINAIHDKTVTITTIQKTVGKISPFARGTNAAPGGMAIVNERGPELARLGNAWWMLGNGKRGAQMAPVPKGTEIFTAPETRALMSLGIPAYAKGKKLSKSERKQRRQDRNQAKRDSLVGGLTGALSVADLTADTADDIAALTNLIAYYKTIAGGDMSQQLANLSAAKKIKNPLKRKAQVDALNDALSNIKQYTDQLADLTGTTSGAVDSDELSRQAALADLYKQLATTNAQGLAVSQAQYSALGQTPFYGSFAKGGVAGESGPVNVELHEYADGRRALKVNGKDQEIKRATRRMARGGNRPLPGRAGTGATN